MDQNAKNERDKKYNCWARKMPAVICLIFPFTIFLVIAFSQENVKGEDVVWYLTKAIAWGGAIFTALMFLLKAVIRDFSAMLVDNLFFNRMWRHYMYKILMEKGRGISEASYNRIVTFQKEKRQIDIGNVNIDEKEKLKRVEDIVSDIKNKTREDNIVFEYNCFYGFYRNLLGGIIISSLLVYFCSHIFGTLLAATNINITDYLYPILLLLFCVCVIFMYYNDYKYAKKMFAAYSSFLDKEK